MASVPRDQLVAYLRDFLQADKGEDYCPNGLQVEGASEVKRIVSGVSACRELFVAARDRHADAVLVHHGIFWRGAKSSLVGYQYRRVRELIQGDLNLLAYHLPLDRHPEVGNNAVAARRLGLEELTPFGEHGGFSIGFSGRFPEARPIERVRTGLREVYGQPGTEFLFGPTKVQHVAIVSGAAPEELHGALHINADLFVTGEASEWVMNVARESRIHFVAAGHYATEKLGVQALGQHLAERFELEVEFVDIPNPV